MRTLFAFSGRGPCVPSAFGTWPSHALHQVHGLPGVHSRYGLHTRCHQFVTR